MRCSPVEQLHPAVAKNKGVLDAAPDLGRSLRRMTEVEFRGVSEQRESQAGYLCGISTYEKGQAFLQEAARLGCIVTLLTVDSLRDADWPRESLTEMLTMPEGLTPQQVLNTVCYMARGRKFDRIVALDEFDLETAALLREHLRMPGMGETATRFFRDKLAIARGKRRRRASLCRSLQASVNYDDLRAFLADGSRALAAEAEDECIGDRESSRSTSQSNCGDFSTSLEICRRITCWNALLRVRCITWKGVSWNGKVLFAAPHKYGHPPMQTMHKGGVFTTRSLPPGSEDAKGLIAIHAATLKALGMNAGVTHTEFIKSKEDGKFYFLETAARVGGAYIAEVVEFAKGLNPWVEWARVEVATVLGKKYKLPKLKEGFAGSVISLARQETPDLSGYTDPEVVMRLKKHHHAGLIVESGSAERVEDLVNSYGERFLADFSASQPVPDKPTA